MGVVWGDYCGVVAIKRGVCRWSVVFKWNTMGLICKEMDKTERKYPIGYGTGRVRERVTL